MYNIARRDFFLIKKIGSCNQIKQICQPIALRKAKIVYNFGLSEYNFGFSECNRVNPMEKYTVPYFQTLPLYKTSETDYKQHNSFCGDPQGNFSHLLYGF